MSAHTVSCHSISCVDETDATADGALLDSTPIAREAGLRISVALTIGGWVERVAWDEEVEARKLEGTGQSAAGWLWDVLVPAALALRRGFEPPSTTFAVLWVPAEGPEVRPRPTRLVLHVGPGDAGEPVVTVLLVGED